METFIPIDIDKVQRVLPTDGRHQVKDGSFLVGNDGFARGQTIIVNSIAIEGTASHWVRSTEPKGRVRACPLTAVPASGSTAPAP